MYSINLILLSLLAFLIPSYAAGDGYIGYHLSQRGDDESVIYETANTPAAGNVSSTIPPPDVL